MLRTRFVPTPPRNCNRTQRHIPGFVPGRLRDLPIFFGRENWRCREDTGPDFIPTPWLLGSAPRAFADEMSRCVFKPQVLCNVHIRENACASPLQCAHTKSKDLKFPGMNTYKKEGRVGAGPARHRAPAAHREAICKLRIASHQARAIRLIFSPAWHPIV